MLHYSFCQTLQHNFPPRLPKSFAMDADSHEFFFVFVFFLVLQSSPAVASKVVCT